jgi:tetratricopeptide (TPR) repeat protein
MKSVMTSSHNAPSLKPFRIPFLVAAALASPLLAPTVADACAFTQSSGADGGPNAYPLNCPKLAHAGAGVLEVVIRDDGAAVLRGLAGKTVVWEKSFPLPEKVNPAKTLAECEESTITLYSQFPFSARTRVFAFSWDGAALRLASSKIEDASADALEALVRAAEVGDELKVEELQRGGDQTPQILYPSNYVTKEAVIDALRRGQAAALTLAREKKPLDAANRMALMFETTVFLGGLIGDVDNLAETAPERWIQTWRARGLNVKDYVGLLNDYGFFLQQAGDHGVAATFFKTVLKLSPGRVAAHLNLGDSLWELSLFDEAKQAYQKYQDALIARRQFKAIPARVVQRLGKVQ